MEEKDKAFVISPFQEPFDEYYKDIFKPALTAAGYEVLRADEIQHADVIIKQVRQSIIDARLVLAEMTGLNANVLYELGLAHAAGKPAILVTQDIQTIPIDIRQLRVIEYKTSQEDWKFKLFISIQETAVHLKDSENVPLPFEPLVASLSPSDPSNSDPERGNDAPNDGSDRYPRRPITKWVKRALQVTQILIFFSILLSFYAGLLILSSPGGGAGFLGILLGIALIGLFLQNYFYLKTGDGAAFKNWLTEKID